MKRAADLRVTVLLSGQGADEALCGYKKYLGFYLQELARGGHMLQAGRVLAAYDFFPLISLELWARRFSDSLTT
jgi:asparagine synthase (glutamine-hydrolysing)